MRISFIVEGDSDKIILDGQRNWFSSLGLWLHEKRLVWIQKIELLPS